VDEDIEEDAKQADHSASKKLTGDALPVLTTASSRRFLSKGKTYGLENKFLLSKNTSRITWSIIKLASMYEGSACKTATTTTTALLYVCSV
jgi:hypothetical protein